MSLSMRNPRIDPHTYDSRNAVFLRLRTRLLILWGGRIYRTMWKNCIKKRLVCLPKVVSYPIYTHVADCEREVLEASRPMIVNVTSVQSEEEVGSFQRMLESREMYIFECTLELFKIFATPGMAEMPTALTASLQLYIRAITGKTLCGQLNWIVSKYQDVFSSLQSNDIDENSSEDGNPFTKMREIFTYWDKMKSHPFAKKLTSIFHHILGTSLLEKFGITYERCFFTKAEAEASARVHNSKMGMLGAVCDGVLYILERLYDVHRTGSWQPILHTGSQYSAWVDETYALKELSVQLHNPEANGIVYHEYVQRVNAAIEKGDALVRYSQDLDSSAVLSAKRLLSEIRLLKANHLTKSAARESRDAPFTLLFFGGSSIGKTTLMEAVHNYFAKVHNLPMGDDYRYTRCFSDEYWSGYTSAVWSLVLDDIASRNPNLGEDKSMEEIIQIINNIPFTPPQADLADKGRTPLRPKLVMGTTNVKHLSALAYYQSELAIRRRLPYVITPTLKAEYAKEVNGCVPPVAYDRMLDSTKTQNCEDPIPNFWEFKVEVVEARPSNQADLPQAAQLKLVRDKIDIYGLLQFVGEESRVHFANQKLVAGSKKSLENMTICTTCLAHSSKCECKVQSFEEVYNFTKTVATETVSVAASCSPYVATALFISGASIGCQLYDFQNLKARMRAAGRYVKPDVFDWASTYGANLINASVRKSAMGYALPVMKAATTSKKFVKHGLSKLVEVRNKLAKAGFALDERLQMEREMMRDYFYAQGEKVRLCVARGNKYLLAAVAGIPLMVGVYALYKSWTSLGVQGTTVPGSILTKQDAKENPWFRDEYEPSTFEVGRLASSWKALPFGDVVSKISRNVGYARFAYTSAAGVKASRPGRFLCLGGHFCVANSHCVPEYGDVQAHVTTTPVGDGINGNFVIRLTQRDIYRPVGTDFAFFRLNNMPPKANLFNCVPGEAFRTVCDGAKIFRDENGQIRTMPVKGIQYTVNEVNEKLAKGIFPSWKCTGPYNTVAGDCGAPLVGNTPQGPHILGLHQLGGSSLLSASVQLTRELVDQALEHFQEPVVQCGAPYLCDPEDKPILLDPIHYKAPVRFIEEGVGYAYGSFPGWRPSHNSEVCDTYIRREMEERGYEVKTGKPVMKGWKPWHLATKDIVQQTFQADQATIDDCVEAYANDILNELSAEDLSEIIVLTDLAAVNGIPGVKYVDKMNRNTSMGWPYNKKKKFFMSEPHQEDLWNDAVDFDDAFYTRVERILDNYRSGTRHMPVFMGHLKDEATKFSKIESGATRLFLGAPADWSFVMRKYLLTFVRVLQNNKYLFEAAPGTNATSMEWEEMYRYLTFFGKDRMIAGDFGKFDKKMVAQWILAAFKVIDRILVRAGWSLEDRRIVFGLGSDTAFPLCNLNGDLVEFWGSNPSGHPLTVIINSIVNALYMRYAWKKGGNELADFKKQVHLMTYGDDNAMGVSVEARNFSHTTIQEEMAKIGVRYTMADKSSESVPYINISEFSFLKRCWRWEPELGAHVAQLEEDSIAKMLTKCLPSKVVCPERQAVDLMHNAMGEYFYYGREIFEKKRVMFSEVIQKLDLTPYVVRDLPTFDIMIEGYKEASKDISFKW